MDSVEHDLGRKLLDLYVRRELTFTAVREELIDARARLAYDRDSVELNAAMQKMLRDLPFQQRIKTPEQILHWLMGELQRIRRQPDFTEGDGI